MSIAVFATLAFTGSNSRGSSLSFARQDAKGVAEGGFNRAAAVLWKNYQANPSSTVLPVCTTNCVSGLSAGQSVTWTTVLESGSGPTRIWKISARGTVPNPSGPSGSPITRTITGKFKIGNVPNLDAWKGVYAANQGSDCFMQNSVVVKTPMYIRQSSPTTTTCIKDNGTKYLGSFLMIRGRFQSNDSGATVGQPASASQPGDPNYPNEFRVPDVHISGQCSSGAACTESHRVWRCTTGAPCYDDVAPDIPKPAVDFTYWRNNAKPGPGAGNGCDVSSGSVPSFSTTSEITIVGSAYNCEVWEGGEMVGKLQWQPGSGSTPGTLTVHGTIYFSGKLLFTNAYAKVSGTGVIYVANSIMMDSPTSSFGALCGVVDTNPGRPHCSNSEGPDGWDPGTTTDFLFFVTGNVGGSTAVSMDIKNAYEFQGSIYAVGKFILQNTASFKGPVVADKLELKNDSVIQGWTPLVTIPNSAPGTTPGLQLVAESWTG